MHIRRTATELGSGHSSRGYGPSRAQLLPRQRLLHRRSSYRMEPPTCWGVGDRGLRVPIVEDISLRLSSRLGSAYVSYPLGHTSQYLTIFSIIIARVSSQSPLPGKWRVESVSIPNDLMQGKKTEDAVRSVLRCTAILAFLHESNHA